MHIELEDSSNEERELIQQKMQILNTKVGGKKQFAFKMPENWFTGNVLRTYSVGIHIEYGYRRRLS
jgi:hypothetical protein